MLESLGRSAGTEIISTEFLGKLFLAVHDPSATLDLSFGREALTTFAHRLEKNEWSSRWRLHMGHRPFCNGLREAKYWLGSLPFAKSFAFRCRHGKARKGSEQKANQSSTAHEFCLIVVKNQ